MGRFGVRNDRYQFQLLSGSQGKQECRFSFRGKLASGAFPLVVFTFEGHEPAWLANGVGLNEQEACLPTWFHGSSCQFSEAFVAG